MDYYGTAVALGVIAVIGVVVYLVSHKKHKEVGPAKIVDVTPEKTNIEEK